MTFDPYPVELFARCMLAMAQQRDVTPLLSSGVGSWRVSLHPPTNVLAFSAAPTVRVERLDEGTSIQREIPELGALEQIINPNRPVIAFLEAVLTAMIELGAPRPSPDAPPTDPRSFPC